MSDTVRIRVPGKAEYMQTVRIAMQSLASNAGFDLDKCDDICVSTVEACKIVCCHEHKSFSNYYDITAEIVDAGEKDSAGIKITIVDSHEHELEKLHKPCLLCPGDGDLALDVMRTLMDRVEFGSDSEGNRRIVLEKRK